MSLGKSCAEIIVNLHRLFIHFIKEYLIQKVLDHTPRHRSLTGKKGQLFPLVYFIGLIGGFIYSKFER